MGADAAIGRALGVLIFRGPLVVWLFAFPLSALSELTPFLRRCKVRVSFAVIPGRRFRASQSEVKMSGRFVVVRGCTSLLLVLFSAAELSCSLCSRFLFAYASRGSEIALREAATNRASCQSDK